MARGPIVNNQATAAHTLESHLPGERVLLGHEAIDRVPVLDGARRPEESGDVAIGEMVSALEERDVRLWLVAKETRSPHPRPPLRHLLRPHHKTASPLDLEVMTDESLPGGDLPRKKRERIVRKKLGMSAEGRRRQTLAVVEADVLGDALIMVAYRRWRRDTVAHHDHVIPFKAGIAGIPAPVAASHLAPRQFRVRCRTGWLESRFLADHESAADALELERDTAPLNSMPAQERPAGHDGTSVISSEWPARQTLADVDFVHRMDIVAGDVHRDDHTSAWHVEGQSLLLAQKRPALARAAAGQLDEVEGQLRLLPRLPPSRDERPHLVTVVPRVFAHSGVRLALVPHDTSYGVRRHRRDPAVE